MIELETFEKAIYRAFKGDKFKCSSFTAYLIKHVDEGKFSVGSELPTIKQLADESKLSISTISWALELMAKLNYLNAGKRFPGMITHRNI